ncbi:MAG: galactokinase [Atopobiaceae bacterium]|nr:galactokinase [Atopobiaceae bacterium]
MSDIVSFDGFAAKRLVESFNQIFGLGDWRERFFVRTPGRTEVAGNHTDHQGGTVIAASVDRFVRGVCAANEKPLIRVYSEGFGDVEIRCDELSAREEEKNTTISLVRGMAAQFAEKGFVPRGFDLYVNSEVLGGSGLSSSAAFEVELGQAMNVLWAKGIVSPEELAIMGKTTERMWFGKPCGLMDQSAVALGGIQHMSFAVPDEIDATSIDFDFADAGYAICLTATGDSHADLTDEYAAIPAEMNQVAQALGAEHLGQLSEDALMAQLPSLRATCGDRPLMRAIHFFREERMVSYRAEALKNDDIETFLKATRLSGASSAMYLQNVSVSRLPDQPAMLALAVSGELLGTAGASRIHGGGFGGTIQAFVPVERVESYMEGMDSVFGKGACQVYQVDHVGSHAWRL